MSGGSETTRKHKEEASGRVSCAVITVSTTRKLADDESGKMIKQYLLEKGHIVKKHIVVSDDTGQIREGLREFIMEGISTVVLNGGTGISKKDLTVKAVSDLFDRELTGFKTLFSSLSYESIGSAAMASQATAGIIDNTLVFCLPGSPNAVRLGMEKLILPELPHLVKHVNE